MVGRHGSEPPGLTYGVAPGKNLTFSEYGHAAYHIKSDNVCSNMLAHILPKDTLLTQWVGSKGQTIYFSESSHVAYQIKGNLAQSTGKENTLSLHTPTTPGMGSKGHIFFFSKIDHVTYQSYQMKLEEV